MGWDGWWRGVMFDGGVWRGSFVCREFCLGRGESGREERKKERKEERGRMALDVKLLVWKTALFAESLV